MGAPWRTARVWARRRTKLARARAAAVLRQNYMLVFTLGALAVAFAIGSGVFNGSSRPVLVAAEPTVALVLTPTFNSSAPSLTITYFLVGSENAQNALRASDSQAIYREILARDHFEVMLARNPDEEQAAMREIELARQRAPTVAIVVIDLRSQPVGR